jgi:hypothetical protein
MLNAWELNTLVNAAISKGDVATITKVLGLPGTDVNALAADGGSSPMQTLLGSAVTPQYVQVLALLLQNGADPNLAQPGVSPPLTQLLASKGSLSSQGAHLLPALKLLLEKGANPNLHLSGCNSPLMQVLLGVPVENTDGQRPIGQPHLSAGYEKLRFAAANLLIQHGADPQTDCCELRSASISADHYENFSVLRKSDAGFAESAHVFTRCRRTRISTVYLHEAFPPLSQQ